MASSITDIVDQTSEKNLAVNKKITSECFVLGNYSWQQKSAVKFVANTDFFNWVRLE